MFASRILTTPEVMILGGVGCLVCCISAMVMHGGYRRGVVGIAVICIMIGAAFPYSVHLAGEKDSFFLVIPLLGGCMALASVFLVPILMIAGLCERSFPWKTKIWHASLVATAWILRIGMVFFHFFDGFH